MPRSRHVRRHGGLALIYAVIAMVALCAFVSLAVDLGKVQLAKTELMRAADAAARAAASELSNGSNLTTIQNAAVNIAAANKCDGTAVSISTSTDIDYGTWDPIAKTFTNLGSGAYASANAIRVTARRTNATSNAITLAYGRVIGQSTCDVKAASIAYIPQPDPSITGLTKFVAHSGLYLASYNSNSILIPSQYTGYHSNNGELGSNGSIDLGTSGNLWGDEYRGRNCTVTSNGLIHGTTHNLGTNLPTPTQTAMSSSSNPGGVSTTPTISGNVSWPGGTYYFTSFTMGDDDSVTFTGVATINMNGNFTAHDRCLIIPYGLKAGNLVWNQASGTTFTVHDFFSIGAQFFGPSASFVADNDFYFGGTMLFKNITLNDDCQLFNDETLSSLGSSSSEIMSVQ